MRLASLLVALLFAPALAQADVPPPEGYVETCDVSYYAREGTRCESCSTWHSDESPCAQRPELSSLTRCCQTAGASVWTEVWCEGACPEPDVPRAPAAASAPDDDEDDEDEEDGGCSVRPGRSAPWSLLGLAMAAIVVVRTTRRRW